MPVRDHCEMLSKQFLLATQLPDHPNRVDLTEQRPDRLMKSTLQSKHGEYVKSITTDGHSQAQHKARLKMIHTECVAATISNQANNPVLNMPRPDVHHTEKELPRSTRVRLAQLRSGYSSNLNSYLCKIRDDVQDICPDCSLPGHTTEHLFNCDAKPTGLNVNSLWTHPKDAARFLGLATGPATVIDNG